MNNLKNLTAAGVLVLAAGGCLAAQNNTAELFGGYSYAKINPENALPKESAHGWVGSAAGYANKWFGAGVEIAAHFGDITPPASAPSLHFKEYSYMAGPQFRFVNTEKAQAAFRLFLGGVFGQVNLDSSTTPAQSQALGAAGYNSFNGTKFAMLAAVPIDFTLSRLFALRVEPGLYMTAFNKEKQNNFRFSVGPVFRFGGGK